MVISCQKIASGRFRMQNDLSISHQHQKRQTDIRSVEREIETTEERVVEIKDNMSVWKIMWINFLDPNAKYRYWEKKFLELPTNYKKD